eukprot:gene23041-9401_t
MARHRQQGLTAEQVPLRYVISPDLDLFYNNSCAKLLQVPWTMKMANSPPLQNDVSDHEPALRFTHILCAQGGRHCNRQTGIP